MKRLPLLLFASILPLIACDNTDTKKQTAVKQTEELLCFESTSPDAFRATPLYDYLKLSVYKDGAVEGMGGGFVMMGSMKWVSNLQGTLTGDTIKLKVTYEVENAEFDDYRGPFTTTETWYFDTGKKHLRRIDGVAIQRWLGEAEYHRIELQEIPPDVASRLKTISLR